MNEFSNLEENDILVYANEFSEINLNGYLIFNKNIELLNECDIVIKQLYNDIDSIVLYIKKTKNVVNFFTNWNENIDEFKNKNFVKYIKPSLKSLQAPSFNMQIEFRCCDDDIIPNCKFNSYEQFSMFVAGHVLPFYEDNYDCYTHFINVGFDDLHRCNANTKENIQEYQDLAELTALYWIWKNLDISDLKYIGFSTYRKPFLKSNKDLYDILNRDGFDCIVNRYYSNFYKTHEIELGKENVNEFENILKNIMSTKEFSDFIEDYERGTFIYICNSFIISTDNFNWMFT